MPVTPKQHRTFEMAKHDPKKAKTLGFDIPVKTATKLAKEPIKKQANRPPDRSQERNPDRNKALRAAAKNFEEKLK